MKVLKTSNRKFRLSMLTVSSETSMNFRFGKKYQTISVDIFMYFDNSGTD